MSKRIVDEEMRFSIIVNGNQAQKELFELENSTRKLTQSNKNLRAEQARLVSQGKKNTQEYKNLSTEIKQNNATIKANKVQMKVLQNQIGITGLTMGQLSSKANQLKLQLRNMVPGSAQYKKLDAELKQISLRMQELRGKASATKLSISSIADGFTRYAALGASFIATTTGVVIGLQKLIDYNGQLSDAQSNVRKTTGLTNNEVKDLTKSFGLLKTRTTRIELLKLAEEAGRLGIEGVDNIKDFVEVANQLKVALGDDLGDEQIREVGKMVKIYKVGERTGRDYKNSLLSLGSAINEVSASGANQAGFLVDYLKRQAGVAAQARISAEDNLAYAATFDEIGQTVEVSATAMNKIWVDMFDNTSTYAKIAGVSIEEFTTLLNTDANKAMILFLKGLNGNNEGLQEMVVKLKDLEVGGARGTAALSALAANTDLLEKRQSQSNKALSEAVSLTNEYNLKNNNLAGTLDKIKKKVLGWFSSDGLVSFLSAAANGFAKLIGATTKSTAALEAERLELLKLESRVKDVNTTQSDRIKLIKEFQDKYPGYLANLSAEKVSNQQLTGAIKAVNEQLINKIVLQEKDTEIEDQLNRTAQRKIDKINQEEEVRARMVKLADKHNITLQENVSLQQQAQDVVNKIGISGGVAIDPVAKLSHELRELQIIEGDLNRELNIANQLSEKRDELAKRLNITLKDRSSDANQPKEGDTQLIDGITFIYRGGKWVPLVVTPKTTDDAKKSAQKRAEELLQVQREAEDLKIQLIKDSFDREMAQENLNHKRKLEDLEKKKISENLITQAQKSGNTNLADSYIAKNAAINSQIESENQLHELRKATIFEKGIQDQIEKKKEAYLLEEQAQLTAFNNQIALLGDNKKAREALEKQFDKASLEREKAHLQDLFNELQSVVAASDGKLFNFELLTDQQLSDIKSKLSDLGLSIAEINALLGVMRGEGTSDSVFTGDAGKTDVLGFSADDWVNTFTNIDSLKTGVEAASMAVNGLMNAWAMYSRFQAKNQQTDLDNFDKTNDAKKAKQKQLLDQGYINERQYDDAIEALENEAEKRRAQLAYQQAKRDKEMSLVGAITGTASAVVGALGNKPWTPANFVLAGIVGALGLAQVGLIAGTKLPAKGYEQGYYQVQREQDGRVFNAQFGGESRTGLVDKPTVFLAGEGGKNFPEMIIDGASFKQMNPNVKQALYSELARVKGFERGYTQNETQQAIQFNNPSTTASSDNAMLISTLSRTNDLLAKIEQEGFVAVMDKSFRNLKKLQEELDKYNKLKLKNKR